MADPATEGGSSARDAHEQQPHGQAHDHHDPLDLDLDPVEPIQVDSDLGDGSDADSAYGGSDDSESTQSLYSTITKHVYENGRRYHSYRQGAYWGPNDETAQDNLDLYHHLFTMTLGGRLYLAPIQANPQRVLDLGTGTGIWAMDFADDHPSASVIATDLSPIQPSLVPPNLEFQIDDFCEPWTFSPLESFDFIHARCIYGCVADYPELYQEVLANLKPGAWFEQAEISVIPQCSDGSFNGTSLERWGPLAIEAGVKFGKSFGIAEDVEGLMRAAGFVNVKKHVFRWPIGPWPKDQGLKLIGSYNRLGWEQGLEGWAMFLFTKFLGWRVEEVHVLLAHIRRELRNPAIHSFQDIVICYGQKPEK